MAKIISGRVKKTPQSRITSDRYEFLGLDQAEPDLGDPLVGPSSVSINPFDSNTNESYILISDNSGTGKRYWTKSVSDLNIGFADIQDLSVPGTSTLGFATVSNLYSSGISTFASDILVNGDGRFLGIVTATTFYGSGLGLTDIVSNQIVDINNDQIYYPILSPNSSGTIPYFSVSSSSIVFNPELNYLGIGTTNPQAPVELHTQDGILRFGDVSDYNNSTDNGISFLPFNYGIGGITSYKSSVFTEVNGRIISLGVNVLQVEEERDTNYPGGLVRIDTRTSGNWSNSNSFVVKRQPVGVGTTQGDSGEVNGIVINLNDGNTYAVPNGGTLFVGIANTDSLVDAGPEIPKIGSSNIKLQVGTDSTPQDAYISGRLSVNTTSELGVLQVGSASSTFIITETGFVGVNTTLPTSALTISGDINFDSTSGREIKWSANSDGAFIKFISTDDSPGSSYLEIGTLDNLSEPIKFTQTGEFGREVKALINSDGNFLIGSVETSTGSESQELQVNSGAYISGNMGIGATNPSSKLTVEGDVIISGVITAFDYNTTSDERLKENINKIENPIDIVSKINGVTFNWKETKKQSAGVIAQEVESVFPEIISEGEIKTVNYNGLIGLLIESVKELKKENEDLKVQIGKINDLLNNQ